MNDEKEKFDSSFITDLKEVTPDQTTLTGVIVPQKNNGEADSGLEKILVPPDMVLKDDFDGDDFTSSVVPKGMEVDDDDEEEDEEENPDKYQFGKPTVIQTASAYQCPICHTTFCTKNRMGATRCFYCGAAGIKKVEDAKFGDFHIVPFMDTIKDAHSIYKKKIRWNPLVPFSFRSSNALKKMRKVYVPCSLYDITTNGQITFIGGERVSQVKGAPMQMFESLYTTEFEYDNLLSSNCPQIGDECLSVINNYNFSNLKDFDPNSLIDSFVMVGTEPTKESVQFILDKVLRYSVNIVRSNVEHSLKKVGKNELDPQIVSYKNVFVPVYYLSQKYNGKSYRFIMNGQTGDSIFDYPISGLSVAVFSVAVVAIVFGIVALIASFL